MIDWTKWKLVPVEATQAMLDAAEKIDWSGEDVLGNCCNQWYAMLAAAPQTPVVEVTMAQAEEITRIMDSKPMRMTRVANGHDMIAAVQQVLGPTLGMVTREELALAVEAAYRDGHGDGVQAERNLCQNDESYNENDDWDASATRKALGGGE